MRLLALGTHFVGEALHVEYRAIRTDLPEPFRARPRPTRHVVALRAMARSARLAFRIPIN